MKAMAGLANGTLSDLPLRVECSTRERQFTERNGLRIYVNSSYRPYTMHYGSELFCRSTFRELLELSPLVREYLPVRTQVRLAAHSGSPSKSGRMYLNVAGGKVEPAVDRHPIAGDTDCDFEDMKCFFQGNMPEEIIRSWVVHERSSSLR